MIFNIALRELRSLFYSPLAWCILAVVQVITAIYFFFFVEEYIQYQSQIVSLGVTEFVAARLFASISIILLLIIPLISMRLISDERRSRTLALLFSAPISMTEIILGKYLGVMLFMLIVLAMISLMPLSLLLGGGLDFGMFFSGLLGLTFIIASFSAVGLFMSTLTQQPTIAAIASFGAFLIFLLLGLQGNDGGESLLGYLSILNHYEPFLLGKFDTADAIYHVLFIATFLVLSVRRMDADRLGA